MAGWSYQWINQLDWAPDSWTAPVDVLRISPHTDTTTATVTQVQRLVADLGDTDDVAMFVFDAGYDAIALGAELADTRASQAQHASNNYVTPLKWGPAALDQIVRTVIVWRRQNDVVDLDDVTFAPPEEIDARK